jgi:hypothetical protein
MNRSILAMTTAMALALPTMSNANIEATVVDVLERNGYPASSIETLTQGEIAELYITATSEGASDVASVLRGIEFADAGADDRMMNADPSDVEMTVARVLEQNGYSADMVGALSSTDIANIYVAHTSEDQTATSDATASAIETNAGTASGDPSAAQERAMTYLARQGYSMDVIDGIGKTELLSIYVALTSGDQREIDRAIESVVES